MTHAGPGCLRSELRVRPAPRARWIGWPLAAAGVALLLSASPFGALAQSSGSTSTRQVAVSEAKPVWAALTAEQQTALAPLKPEWSGIDAARKQKWLDLAARMPSMTSSERERIQARMTEWVRMTPGERGRARMQFQEARQLPPSTRQQQWEAYQALPADKRQALASKATQPKKPAEPVAATRTDQTGASTSARGADPKRNIVSLPPPSQAPKPVGPTVVQTRPGATTSLVTTPSAPPAHHQAGLPKVNARAGFVDPATLLPKRGPQGAAAVSAAPNPGSAGSTP